jgi:hypothetical protein
MLMNPVSDLLQSASLTDARILTVEGWDEVVAPQTRPFLEYLQGVLRESLHIDDLHLGRLTHEVKTKRDYFDRLFFHPIPGVTDMRTGVAAGVLVGLASEGGEFEQCLVWGAWADYGAANTYGATFELIKKDPFRTFLRDFKKAGTFRGGSSRMILVAESASDLRGKSAESTATRIAEDLAALTATLRHWYPLGR